VVFAEAMCQKQKSPEGKTPKAAISESMMSTDSMMMGGNTRMADSSMKMTDSAGKNMMADSMSKSTVSGYYTCTMHPQVHEAKPGKCPICGMDLVFKKSSKQTGKIDKLSQNK
jgi:rubrerythrin